MRTVAATRYVTPLREGGSLPAVVEADDDGLYVLKFRGAGQGAKALVAELVAGEAARALGLPIPEIVLVELDVDLARTEPDPEIQDLIRASGGLNLGLDYLSGSLAYDPAAFDVDAELASRIVWFDALVANLDRTPRNSNLLVWHRRLWMIDHGAALYFHHALDGSAGIGCRAAQRPFPHIAEHVMLARATRVEAVDTALAARLPRDAIERIVRLVPEAWLEGGADRAMYVDFLTERLRTPRRFAAEAAAAAHALSTSAA